MGFRIVEETIASGDVTIEYLDLRHRRQAQIIRQNRHTALVLPQCIATPVKLPVAAYEVRVGVLTVAIVLQQAHIAFDGLLEAALREMLLSGIVDNSDLLI
jgi:hypothetical protein